MLTRPAPKTTTLRAAVVATATVAPGGVPAGFHAYTDAAAQVQIAIPDGWQTQGNVGSAPGFEAARPDGLIGLYLRSFDVAGYTKGGIDAMMTATKATNRTDATLVTLSGETWVQESGEASVDGTAVRFEVLGTSFNGKTYIVSFFAVSASFADADLRYFQPAVHSFTFLRAPVGNG